MPEYKYATKDLAINNAKAFISAMSATDTTAVKSSVILYAILGKGTNFTNEPTPDEPANNEQYLHFSVMREMIGGRKITTDDVSHVVPRYSWENGTVYSMYRDSDVNMYERAFYVLTDEDNVYKCLYNNKGGTSTVKPAGFSTSPFSTSDGYTWKYMYTVSLGDSNKFMTSTHMPVKSVTTSDGSVESTRQLAVQNAAVNGAIEVVESVQLGSGYVALANGVVAAGGVNTLRLDTNDTDPPSAIDNFYNGSSVYVKSGTGAGQLRRIINWEGSSKTLTVNTAFATVCNSDSRVIISPTVTIIGDGSGAKAYTTVDVGTGAISNIAVIDTGTGYRQADAYITSNTIHGSGATANVVISPVGGHGSDPVRELYGDKVCLNVQFQGAEGVYANGNGYIPSNTDFRTVSILKDPILKVDQNNRHILVEKIANTSNSPATLNMMTRLQISYLQMDGTEPVNGLAVNNIITNERNRLRAETGQLEFVTELNPIARQNAAMTNAVRSANANIVVLNEDPTVTDPSFYIAYINNVEAHGGYAAFTKDDVILKSTSATKIATIEDIKGPEANTFSGEILYTENIQKVTRNPDQIEDIKVVLDF
jgi:hypothetical protein